jgi:DNA-binding MarR family transcriptional regulator
VLRLARRLRQTRDESVELTASQYSVLAALSIRGRLSMGELAAEERVRPPTVTRVVNALAERDLVRRTPAPHDGRQSLVDLTESGRALLLANQRLRAEWLADRLADLDAAELDVLRTAIPLLSRVAAG